MSRILIIDDNETMREGMAATVRRMGHEVVIASSGTEGLSLFRSGGADFVVTDLKMEGLGGIGVLQAVRELDPKVPTMIVTAFGSVETAVEAMRLGALDFIQKPFSPEVLRLKVQRALEIGQDRRARYRAEAEVEALRADAAVPYGLGDMVGQSAGMQKVFALIDRVAPSDITVHIHGESGTGKELVARALHLRSKRADRPFVKVNCGALAETLLESELFGHEKGAFTGAIRRKIGRFELADTGTLFLDEVGDMSAGLQVKLLRVLQEKSFERVGGEDPVHVDVRVISATHRNLKTLVETGQFREDLFYRMHVVTCDVPPLRDRREDIPLLCDHFLRSLGPRINPSVVRIDDNVLARLTAHAWPGNVRELQNVMEQALVFADGDRISMGALPAFLHDGTASGGLSIPAGEMSLPEILEDLERQLIARAYDKTGGVKTETARLLGIKTSALYYKLEKYRIGEIAGREAGDRPADSPERGESGSDDS
ncbi:MAG: sigma-54 dependent transcriptional regulator [Deltaproteobacteria bacterium]|nr:sigma-54 dependent transcriptional regulator [Deltaproteobacteria bacterium]